MHKKSEGLKHDNGKTRYDLIPIDALDEIAQVLTHGANKYGPRNWEAGISYSRIFRALLGHIFAWWTGKGTDEETGKSHLAHAGCCILFLVAYETRVMKEFDDRPLRGTNDSA